MPGTVSGLGSAGFRQLPPSTQVRSRNPAKACLAPYLGSSGETIRSACFFGGWARRGPHPSHIMKRVLIGLLAFFCGVTVLAAMLALGYVIQG